MKDLTVLINIVQHVSSRWKQEVVRYLTDIFLYMNYAFWFWHSWFEYFLLFYIVDWSFSS